MKDVHMLVPVGVGIDLVRIQRFEEKLEDERFLSRIFSEKELASTGTGVFRASHMAGIWAVKEAVAKALGCGFGNELGWREIEVSHNDKGQPQVTLTDEAAKHHQCPIFHVSISHEGKFATAIVNAYRENP